MDFVIKSAERTKNQMAVALTLLNSMIIIVGNGIIDKILAADNISFDFFRPLCAAGGYVLSVDGKMVEHAAGDTYGEGKEYKNAGYHIDADEDVYPSILQSDKYFDLKVKIPKHATAVLLSNTVSGAVQNTPPVQTDETPDDDVVDTNTGELNPDTPTA